MPVNRPAQAISTPALRIIMALIAVIGGGSGGYIFRGSLASAPDAVAASTQETVDRQARQQIELFKVEIRGELGLIRQQQEQTNERLKELLARSERVERYQRAGGIR